MFCPFYFRSGIFSCFARYVLGTEPQEENESENTSNSSRQMVELTHVIGNATILKNKMGNTRFTYKISGEGMAVSKNKIIQDKAYFEVKILKPGKVRIGIAKSSKLHSELIGKFDDFWGAEFGTSGTKAEIGTVIGCCFDQSDIPAVIWYTKDGNDVEPRCSGMKGSLVPAISVEAGAVVEVVFDSKLLENYPPQGFSPIICSQSFEF